MTELGTLLVLPTPPTKEPKASTSWGGTHQPSYAISGYWTPTRLRAALNANDAGSFGPILALKSYLTRDAIIGGMGGVRGQRISAPLGLPVDLELPEGFEASDRRSPAQRVLEATRPTFENGAFGPLVRAHLEGELADFGIGIASLTWTPDPGGGGWTPRLEPWSLDATRIHETTGQLMACLQDGTEEPIVPGNGRWVVIQATLIRPWEEGAVRSIASSIMSRAMADRDANRFSEGAGQNPIIGTAPIDIEKTKDLPAFTSAVQGLTTGQQGMIKFAGCDVTRLNSNPGQMEIFTKISAAKASDAAKGYLGQDGTAAKGTTGTYGAVAVLDGVRYDLVERDCSALSAAWLQISIPFAYYNFGRPDLAPTLGFCIPDPEEEAREKAEHDEVRASRKAMHEELASLKSEGAELTADLILEVADAYDVDMTPALAEAIAQGLAKKPAAPPDMTPSNPSLTG